MTIARAVIDVAGPLVEKDTKTHAVRPIAVPAVVVADLQAQHVRRAARVVTEVSPELFVWRPRSTLAGCPDQVTGAFRRLCEREGVKARFHDLRHGVATEPLAAGVDVRAVSGRLGHAKAPTTLDIYSHWVPAAHRKAADVLGSSLGGATVRQNRDEGTEWHVGGGCGSGGGAGVYRVGSRLGGLLRTVSRRDHPPVRGRRRGDRTGPGHRGLRRLRTATRTDRSGNVDGSGNFLKVSLKEGGFKVDATALTPQLNDGTLGVAPASCSASAAETGAAPVSDGSGAYAGIGGTLTLTETYAFVAPRWSTGPDKGKCTGPGLAPPLRQFSAVTAVGRVTLRSAPASTTTTTVRRPPASTTTTTVSPPPTTPPAPPSTTPACYPLSEEGTCYEPGEYCPDKYHGDSGIAGDGKPITCEDNDGWRWEPS